jgi:hypothetical protein
MIGTLVLISEHETFRRVRFAAACDIKTIGLACVVRETEQTVRINDSVILPKSPTQEYYLKSLRI